jgi:hypothetical protein
MKQSLFEKSLYYKLIYCKAVLLGFGKWSEFYFAKIYELVSKWLDGPRLVRLGVRSRKLSNVSQSLDG